MLDIKIITEWAKEHNYSPVFHGQDPNLVLLGMTHTNPPSVAAQVALAERVKPEFFLDEDFGAVIYDGKTQELRFHPNIPVNALDREMRESGLDQYRIDMADANKLVIVGMDLSNEELANMGIWDIMSKKADGPRERRMAYRMGEYLPKTDQPIIASAGQSHTLESHQIQKQLGRYGIPYVHVIQPQR